MTPKPATAPTGKAPAESLLIAPRTPITRYRPVVVAGGVGAILLLVGLGFLLGFSGGHRGKTAKPVVAERPEAPPSPDLKNAPTSYADTANLAPRPGELSLADTASATPDAPLGPAQSPQQPPVDPAQQRAAEQARSAHEGGPFFGAPVSAAASIPPPALALATPDGAAPSAGVALSAKQQFVASAHMSEDYAAGSETPPRSPYEVKAGAVIPAALLTGLNSDLPGEVIAQVTEPVFDHASGQILLIPQGARLIGQYDSQASYGQDRLLLVWNRLIFPDGRSINIGTMTGVDGTGASGLSDRADTHLPILMRAVGLSTLVTLGGAVAQNAAARSNGNLILSDSAGGVAQSASLVGGRLVDRDLARQPTLRVRPGFRVDVLVSRDLTLEPYAPAR